MNPSYAGITPERIKANRGGIHWPCPSADHPGTPILHVNGFNKPNGRGVITPVESQPAAEDPCEDYPLLLTTGRVVMHYNSGTMTRRTPVLLEREPGLFVQLNPMTAQRLGLENGDVAQISTRRGEARAKVKVSRQIAKDVAFMPFHFADTNLLTNDALDPTAKIPEYKVAACKIAPVNGGAR
jgi:formate dehydrogenase (coenzyme F420) alpha subunit